MDYKTCTLCGKDKKITKYYPNRSQCKRCYLDKQKHAVVDNIIQKLDIGSSTTHDENTGLGRLKSTKLDSCQDKINDIILEMREEIAKLRNEIYNNNTVIAKMHEENTKLRDDVDKANDGVLEIRDKYTELRDMLAENNDIILEIRDDASYNNIVIVETRAEVDKTNKSVEENTRILDDKTNNIIKEMQEKCQESRDKMVETNDIIVEMREDFKRRDAAMGYYQQITAKTENIMQEMRLQISGIGSVNNLHKKVVVLETNFGKLQTVPDYVDKNIRQYISVSTELREEIRRINDKIRETDVLLKKDRDNAIYNNKMFTTIANVYYKFIMGYMDKHAVDEKLSRKGYMIKKKNAD